MFSGKLCVWATFFFSNLLPTGGIRSLVDQRFSEKKKEKEMATESMVSCQSGLMWANGATYVSNRQDTSAKTTFAGKLINVNI